MNHNELLNKVADRLGQTNKNAINMEKIKDATATIEEAETDEILNKIGLEIQRQGGY